MSCIAHKGNAPLGPKWQSIFVNHWVFKNLLGLQDEFWHIEKVELEIFVNFCTDAWIDRTIPVVHDSVGFLQFGHPVN